MTAKHIYKTDDYINYTVLIVDKFNELIRLLHKNNKNCTRIVNNIAIAKLISNNTNFKFNYSMLILPEGQILSDKPSKFINCLINIIERTDILTQHTKNNADFVISDVGQEHIRYIDENIRNIKNMMSDFNNIYKTLKKNL